MKRAVYPGSFDPVTNGHMDIIHRAADMFDELIVLVSSNVKKTPLFLVSERVKILEELTAEYSNVKVDSFDGLLCDYTEKNDIHISIRGLRAVSDYEYELQIAQTNFMLSQGGLDTIFLVTGIEYSYLSSSGVKEIAYFGGDVSKCVPELVADLIREKYKDIRNDKMI